MPKKPFRSTICCIAIGALLFFPDMVSKQVEALRQHPPPSDSAGPSVDNSEPMSQEATLEINNVDFRQEPKGYFPDLKFKMLGPGSAHFGFFATNTHVKLDQQDMQIAWDGQYPIEHPGSFEQIVATTNEKWPSTVDLKITLQFKKENALGAVLLIGADSFPNEGSGFQLCSVDPPALSTSAGVPFTFTYWLAEKSNVTLNVFRLKDNATVDSTSADNIAEGLHRFEWNPAHQPSGDYGLRITGAPLNGKRSLTIAALFRITAPQLQPQQNRRQ